MTELLTAAQMRAIETAAIESGTVTGLELMERAGQGVIAAVFEEWPALAHSSYRAVVLCGPGNNGGDGFVVARLLRKLGWDVDLYLYGDPAKLPPDARANHDRWCAMGQVRPWLPDEIAAERADLFVDAIFGAGLTRAVPAQIMEPLITLYVSCATFDRMVAIDAPTGLCMDSGRCLSETEGASYAWLTVTFHRMRAGHLLADGPFHCGKLALCDIGLTGVPENSVRAVGGLDAYDVEKYESDHKFQHGHALVLSGVAGRTGAARLAARGALRVGAGLVTLGVPGSAQIEVASQITALMLRRAGTVEELTAALEDTRINALCLGPGLGVERARDLVPVALDARRATVLDADALTAFAETPEALFDMLHKDCVLTPHGGEFARLFPDIAARLAEQPTQGPAYSKVDATRAAAERAGCVVLFKGPDTVIAAPNGRAAIHAAAYDRSAPWLATAGAGDVLAGFITGLLARGLHAMAAAEVATWLHVECARSFGPGLIAEDLPEELPKVLRALGA